MNDKFENLLDSGIRNISQAFYDRFVEANAKFRARAGLKVTIVRESLGECCSWCSDLAGTYSYDNAPKDVYARHRDCNCVVSTKTEKGTWQDAHTRREYDTFRENRIAREQEILRETERERVPKTVANYAYGKKAMKVDLEYIESQEYRMKFHGITGDSNVDDKLYESAKEILRERTGTAKETLIIIDKNTGQQIAKIAEKIEDNKITYTKDEWRIIKNAKKEKKKMIAIHNHPEGYPPTADDAVSALHKGYGLGIVCGHNGKVYTYTPAKFKMTVDECKEYHDVLAMQMVEGTDIDGLWRRMLKLIKIDISSR